MGARKIVGKIRRMLTDTSYYMELNRKIFALEKRLELLEYLSVDMPHTDVGKLTKVHFINMMGKGNCGDYNCGPYPYFRGYFENCRCYFHTLVNVNYSVIQKGDYCIFGGGGLVDHDDEWNETIEKVNAISGNVILWGVGKNLHTGDKCGRLNLSGFRLAGLRDYMEQEPYGEYCPCPSCMLPELSYQYESVRKIGVVEHSAFPIMQFPYEKVDNSMELYSLLKFIGTSDVIISNSYHVIYWATLMKKKVIIYEKFSSKFDHLRWEHPVYSGDLSEDMKKCKIYENALEESRCINIKFAEKIKNLLDS